VLFKGTVADSMEQMGFPQPYASVDKEGVIRFSRLLGYR